MRCQVAFLRGLDYRQSQAMVHYFERRSGGNYVNRRWSGEKSKRRKRSRERGLEGGFERREHRNRRTRSRTRSHLHGCMGNDTQRAVRMVYGTAGMGVRDLYRARNHHQQQTHHREQCAPLRSDSVCLAGISHINPLYRRVRQACRRVESWIAEYNNLCHPSQSSCDEDVACNKL